MTEKKRILQLGPLAGSPGAQERLEALYDVVPLWQAEDRAALLKQESPNIRALVTTAVRGCDAATMDALPNLQAICSWGVGFDAIDVKAAHQRGIQVSNTPDVLTDCVADLAWALLLACARRVAEGDRFVRAGQWGSVHGSFPLGRRVTGRKLGILGLGRIGNAIARRGSGFDMEIRYHNRHQRNDVPYAYAETLEELAAWSDFLVIAAVGGAETRNLVDQTILRALGPHGTLINIARGSVVDENALVQALEDGSLGAAGLDVFANEPQVPEALKQSDKVVLLPHIGSATVETRADMVELLFRNLHSFLETGKVITPV
ncbi:2-hydroxyacid dehydrogenase [Kerstersia gyiorum]|jgi:lactate dehydrogenase-like 2-hydroxyacid dehydrogenase|uniref:Hydroxyacid dehydrogenase n=1 Tax=Kerstersia gyiorum TaxID=206506 RepID=A0A171KTL3_9BURK|nr:2-hydroxyacid dehydrogenase [Kerstersia gyiorum]AZV95502.1 2-hydroxyacid dehydrogenase [Bordetella sp. J329]MCO7639582.1 2-hydroxyacid dehydrogenase [Pseudomonas sp. S 311-6]KAB0543038.1 2-hydroxyacid dehydrogenase [Kerstersia gyiorum]KKO72230.1 hydroxyacid dehydrogenase [Kerstersia gyiorum]MCH4272423.1 2-hydroxyacid dehydrogenase [Kerstersia gyiorum]